MAELADAQDLGSCEVIRVGSTPTTRTIRQSLRLTKCYTQALIVSCFCFILGGTLSEKKEFKTCFTIRNRL